MMLDTELIEHRSTNNPLAAGVCPHEQWAVIGRIGGGRVQVGVQEEPDSYEVYRFHCTHCLVFTDRRLVYPTGTAP